MRNQYPLLLSVAASLALLTACNKPVAQTDPAAVAEAAAQNAKETADAAAVAAKEAELAQREAEIAAREAELAAQAKPAEPVVVNKPAKPKPAPVVVAKPATPKPVTPVFTAPPPPVVITVPSGTPLSLALNSAISTKTAKVGDEVRARLLSDVVIDGKTAIYAGTTVAGAVTDVVSGSSKIGGIPTLGVRFDRLELPGGKDVPITGDLSQKGKSDTGRDTAKIVGGAAAGAILGHQVKGGDKGKVLGGLLGGAIGAVAAQKTGTEVTLAEGSEMSIMLSSAVTIYK